MYNAVKTIKSEKEKKKIFPFRYIRSFGKAAYTYLSICYMERNEYICL